MGKFKIVVQDGVVAVPVGQDHLSLTGLPTNVRWIVYHYTCGLYDGSGEALLAFEDGSFAFSGLGHCSCNGPEDNFPDRGDLSRADILTRMGCNPNGGALTPGEWNTNAYQEIWAGVKELGFLHPDKETVRRHLTSTNKALRTYIILNLLPLVGDKLSPGVKY